MNLSKKTAERMLKNIDAQLQALGMEQQAMNGNKGGQKMKKGGRVKMQDRGLVPGGYTFGKSWQKPNMFQDPYKIDWNLPEFNAYTPTGFTPAVYGSQATGTPTTPPVAISDNNLAVQKAMDENAFGKFQKGKTGVLDPSTVGLKKLNTPYTPDLGGLDESGSKFGWQDALGLAPTLFNTIAGLTTKKADKLNPEEFQNPYESQAFSMMPDEYRVDPMLEGNQADYMTYLRNVNNMGNSRGERLAGYRSGYNAKRSADTNAYALKLNEENQMRTRKGMFRNDQGNRRAMTNLTIRDMNDQNESAVRNMRRDYLSAAASGLGNYGTVNKQMANQNASQNAYIEALRRLNPYMSQWLGLDNLGK